MLDIVSVSKSYGDRRVVDRVSLSIGPGEILALLGMNGAGKTTLVSIAAGLLAADEGRVTIDGIDIATDPYRARKHLGFAPQDLGIYPLLTVRENLTYMAELARLRGRAASARIDEVAELLELTELLDRRARFMSGGEKRRLHTALALVHRPRLLLLDEPTTGVDVQSRARLIAAVTAMADGGVALCYTTHYLAEVEAMPARVAIIDSGRIIVRGTVPELVERHAATVVEFDFASAPPPLPDLPEAVVDGNLVRVPTQRPTTTIADVMRLTESTGATLASVELVRPSLETVFLGVTGRRYGAEANGSQADSDSSEAAHA